MFLKLRQLFHKHFRENYLLYFISIVALMIGISAGAITIKALNAEQKKELINFLDSFFKILNDGEINSFILLKQSLLNNLQTVLFIWFFGIIVIGIPILLGVLILRGFVIGFTVGFLIEVVGFKGFLFALFTVLPQNIFVIPGLIIISVIGAKFSVVIIKNRFKHLPRRQSFVNTLTNYTITIAMVSILILIGSLIEAYISPIFMRLISGYIS